MQHFFEWFAQHGNPDRPWLILGKGPSFGLRDRFDLSGYNLLSLNHAVREQPVLLAHMIDLDVVDACGDALLGRAGYVVLPWFPHVDNAPGTHSLETLVPNHPLLRQLAEKGRLLWYDLGLAPRRHGPGPVVQAACFSAEAAVSLLALAGVRRVRSLGVDGGASYSVDFEDLTRRTLLANGQPGFDLQFRGIARTISNTGVDFAPLDWPSPIVACVRSTPGSLLPDKVLEFTVRKHASISVRMHSILSTGDGRIAPARKSDQCGSPSLNGGCRAIVFRSGSLVLDDLRKLWTRPLDREVVEVPQRSQGSEGSVQPAVSIVSASSADRLEAMIRRTSEPGLAPPSDFSVVDGLPASWNRHDRFEEGNTAILLYAAPGLQPWISRSHPLGHLWVAMLLEAVREGFVSLDLIRTEMGLGHVRPSLLEQVERGSLESLLVSWSARRQDANFTPPGGPPAKQAGLLTDPLLVLRTLARHARRELGAYRRRHTAERA